MEIVLAIEFVHAPNVIPNDANEDVDGALLGHPKSELEASEFDLVECVSEEDAAAEGHEGPDSEKGGKDAQIRFPV